MGCVVRGFYLGINFEWEMVNNTVYEFIEPMVFIVNIIILKSTMKYPKQTQKPTNKKTKPLPAHLE